MPHSRIRHAILRGQRIDPARLHAARQMRHAPTPGEATAWAVLRSRGLDGLKFCRQQVIGGFIVDFYCAEHRIVIEVDGDVHDRNGAADADAERTVALNRIGIQVARIRNESVTEESIRSAIAPFLQRSTPLSREGEGVGG